MELSILIPAKNEAITLPETISKLNNILGSSISFNVLIINDHSEDNTIAVLEELSAENQNLKYISNELEGGVGNAIRYGLEKWEGDIVAICMADGSDAPDDILSAYSIISSGEYDCVFGSRFMKGSIVNGYPIVKLIINRFFNIIVKIISSNNYNDFTNIFKIYSRKAIEKIQPLESTGFSIGLEMSLKAFKKKLQIAVVPISWTQRTAGKSKLNLRKNFNLYLSTLKKSLRDVD